MRKQKQIIGLLLIRLSILVVLVAVFSILLFIVLHGFKVINLHFLIEPPKAGMTKGGIFPAIIGTFYLALGSILFALPLGVLSAIYLAEYARYKKWVRVIEIGVNALAGVPSVVFGLFGLAVFVKFFDFGVSILSGSLTLGILILPIIIRATEEAIIAVPIGFREASFALGATKWQTVTKIVLPSSLPGILTGAILGIGRAAGETAPILFTAATFYQGRLPHSIFDEVMVLPYHIYALMTEGTKPEFQVPIAYGTALVLLSLVLGINLIAIIIRTRIRRAKKW
ncbi:phosphate ABC transporter permease PstA [candidate division WOR-3 bacterium]|nr:phosphate ABC transporter permease PstA [candidate division WOR-3 bacterium]